MRRPFMIDINDINDEDLIKDVLIDMRSKAVLRAELHAKAVCDFRCNLGQAYSFLVKRAMFILFPFATTYLCESVFSALVSISTKNCNRLDVKDDMHLTLSKTIPQFSVLVEKK